MTTASDRAHLPRLLTLDGRSLRILKTAASSYLGRLGSALAIFVTIPMAKAGLPPEQFGVWMMLSGLMAFFAFADLGVGNGVLNRVTVAHTANDEAERRRVVIAGYACTGTVGALLFGAWLGWAWLAPDPTVLVGTISPANHDAVLRALGVFAFLLAVNIPVSLVHKVQFGMQAGHWVGLSQLAAALGTLICVPLALAIGGGLAALVAASLGVQMLCALVSTYLWHRQLARRGGRTFDIAPQVRLELRSMVSLLHLGGHFFVLQLAVAIAFQSDAIVIVQRLGQVAYSEFAVIQRIFLAVTSLLLAGLAGLWPAIGEALARGEAAWIKQTLIRSYTIVFFTTAAACTAIAVGMPLILQFWLDVTAPTPPALLIALVAWTLMEAMGHVSGVFMNAAGVLRAQIVATILMSILAFAGKWLLVGEVGAWGAVLATLIAYTVISVPTQIYLIHKNLGKLTSRSQ